MPRIQDKRGNSSYACTKISFEHSMYKAFAWGLSIFFRDLQMVNIVKADQCMHLELEWDHVLAGNDESCYVTGDEVSSIYTYKWLLFFIAKSSLCMK